MNYYGIDDIKQLVKNIMGYNCNKKYFSQIESLLTGIISMIYFFFPQDEKSFNTVLTMLYAKDPRPSDANFKDAIDMMFDDLRAVVANQKPLEQKLEKESFAIETYDSFRTTDIAKHREIVSLSIAVVKKYMNAKKMNYSYSLSVLDALNQKSIKR